MIQMRDFFLWLQRRIAGRAPELVPRHELYDLVDLLTEDEREALLPVVMLLLAGRVQA